MEQNKFPYKSLFIVVAALVYIFSPLDIIPDTFLGFGQLDDLGVLILVWREIRNILKYRKDVKNQKPPEIVADAEFTDSKTDQE